LYEVERAGKGIRYEIREGDKRTRNKGKEEMD
jgi:hypothetical protein